MLAVYKYKAYGLGFHSQWHLADFPTQQVPSDVHIRMADIDPDKYAPEFGSTYRKIHPDNALVSVSEVGIFIVNQGTEILVQLYPNADRSLAQRYLLGTIMAILLNQRGRLVLHASVIDMGGYGIAFLGASGAGKSSTAAAFLAHAHNILVDDLAAVELLNDSANIYPAFPQMNLSRDAVQELGVDPGRLRFMDEVDDKLSFQIIQPHREHPLPLKRIYMLADGDQIEFEHLNSPQAVVELVRYTMPSTYVQMNSEAHFKKCVNLVNQIEMYRLIRPDSLSQLNQLVQRVEDHCHYLN